MDLLDQVVVTFSSAECSVTIDGPAGLSELADAKFGQVARPGGHRHCVLLVPVQGAVGSAAVERIAAAARGAPVSVVVVAAAIGPSVRATLCQRGLGYLDLAGNCHLEFDGGAVSLHVEGRRRVDRPAGGGTLRAAGYQALFGLLAGDELLGRTVRDVAAVTNVSRHAAHSLLARLREEGLLVRTGRSAHGFVPGGREACIDRLAVGWADVLRSRLLVGRFRLRESDPDAAAALVAQALRAAGVPFGFGGARGSARWLQYLQSNETIVHAASFGPDIVQGLGAVPDRNGPLTVVRTMSQLDLATDVAETAHPLLVYAELARSADARSREAAALFLNEVLLGSGR